MTNLRQSWTRLEIKQLTQVVLESKQNCSKLNWELIAKQMNRTASQCKSYYQNMLKKQLNMDKRQNHTWTQNEIMMLWIVMKNYENDYKLAQRDYFSNFSIKIIQSKWVQTRRKYLQHINNFKEVYQNPVFIKQISKRDLIQECYIINVSIKRMDLVKKKIIQRSTEQLADYGYCPDIMEIKGYESIWGDIDPNQISIIYQNEQLLRGIQNYQIEDADVL
ncbi:Myb-like_DNA-binding domain-containing protein [Hexamita inflata]|uniref:Myb-like DNA-binding domain-containing protein n=1 Tax=Hexamita inflata TaxID=28002 RepID=A0AA86UWH4_9EUKA|nr:Myb-like DNA-binding domain-containing protein [Hexamita inflata]